MSFKENIETAAARIMDLLKDKEETTSWQIKISLHFSSSLMFMALGMLAEEGKITAEPDGINYKITKIPQK
ncbi:MAG: winged helix-turn-helix domain-containing protein [Elusimicrobiota bacterium]|jgi:hypothetical protein|nr:winged helix-turn-helix domain-containing protein [Elusimicrobiota bacterium]